MICKCVLGAIRFMMNQNILIVHIAPVNWKTMTMKFVLALNVVDVCIGTETFGNVQTVTIQKKIRKHKSTDRIVCAFTNAHFMRLPKT